MFRQHRPLTHLALLGVLPLLAAVPAAAQTGAYVRAGLGIDGSERTRLRDQDCTRTAPPALFGCGTGIDGRPLAARGDFGTGLAVEAGLGYRLLPALRAEALFGYRLGSEFSGEANFARTPGSQPVAADLESATAMLAGYVDLVGLGLPPLGPVEPFVGGGIGAAHHRLGRVAFTFPGLGDTASTIIGGGTTTSLAFMATAGGAIRLSDRLMLDLAYRYLDLGPVRSEAGLAVITRQTFTRVLDIAGTEANLSTHGITASLRFGF